MAMIIDKKIYKITPDQLYLLTTMIIRLCCKNGLLILKIIHYIAHYTIESLQDCRNPRERTLEQAYNTFGPFLQSIMIIGVGVNDVMMKYLKFM